MTTTVDTVEKLTDQLRQHRLLEPRQLEELTKTLQNHFADPRALAQELLKRGWVTPYQVNQLFQGRGQDLVMGQYVILDRLGEGAAGQVFKARHQRMNRLAALKVIRPELLAQEDTVGRFYREIQAISRLSHTHIVEAYDAGPVSRTHFFAMEYLEGIDLDRLVKKHGPLPFEQACSFIAQAASGLAHAHEKGLVHRDIKPSNLIWSKSNRAKSANVVKILDLGLVHLCRARAVNGRNMTALTETGTLIGTPDFMAPEQIEDPQKVDIRADVYSLGCCLYFLLTGRVCFPNCNLFQKILKIQTVEPTPVEQLRSGVPPALAKLVRRMLAKRPEMRPQTPAEVVAGLNVLLGKAPNAPLTNQSTKETMDGSIRVPSLPSFPALPPLPAANGSLNPSPVPRRSPSVATPRPRRALLLLLFWPFYLVHWLWKRVAWKWRLVFIGGTFLPLLMCGLLTPILFMKPGTLASLVAPTTATTAIPPRESVEKAWQKLAPQVGDPATDPDLLRRQLIAFRVAYPGTPEAHQAAEALMKLPSALDKLDDQTIPAEERFPWQPKELVAVLGTHQQPLADDEERVVFAVASQLIANVLKDNSIQVWHLPTGQKRATFVSKGPVTSLAISPNGRKLAAGLADRTIQLWDVSSGLPRVLAGHSKAVSAVAFDERGDLLATGGLDRTVKVWDTATGQLRYTFEGHQRAILGLTFNADGRILASTSEDGTFKFWDPNTGKTRGGGQQNNQPVRLLGFTPDTKRMVTVSSTDAVVRLWDLTVNNITPRALSGHRTPPHAVAFSPDGLTLATASADPSIRLWDAMTGKERPALITPPSAPLLLAFSADCKALNTWHPDQTLRQWDSATGRPLTILRGPARWLRSTAFAPDGSTLATGSLGGVVQVWEGATAKVRTTLSSQLMAVNTVAYAPNGLALVTVSYDQSVALHDLATGHVQHTLRSQLDSFTAVAYAPDAKSLAIGSTDGSIKLWDAATARQRASLRGHPSAVKSLAFSPDGHALVSGGDDGSVRLWKRATPQEYVSLKDLRGSIRTITLDPTGKRLAAADESSAARLWDATASPPRPVHTLSGHTGTVEALVFRPDGKLLATAGDDGRVILWDPENGQRVREWMYNGGVIGLAFAVDGRHLATVNSNGTVYILRLPP